MIYFNLHDQLHIRIDTDNYQYLKEVKQYFSHYVDGYRWNSRFKSGQWDGKVSLFNGVNRTIPYGIFLELIKYHKKEWPDTEYTISPELKLLFNGIPATYKKNLIWEPYEYQDDCISMCLKTSKGIIRSATASGKSLMISYVCKALFEQEIIKRGIIIVPSIGLVTQFHDDMFEYGMDMTRIGRVGDSLKEWHKPLIISTWQSLQHVPDKIESMDLVIVDETHAVKAKVLSDLIKHSSNARWRFGFTGTMPSSTLEQLQVMSYLGPVLREYGSVELAKLGYVSKCIINMVHIDYKSVYKGDYNNVKNDVFNNTYRMGIIGDIIHNSDGNILLLVGKVEDEGEVLKGVLRNNPQLSNYEVEFLSGRDSGDDREVWRKYMDTGKNVILIATYGIFQQGINIKSLKNLILASPFKSKIRVLQSIGRTLRLHADKKDGAIIWDICDNVKYLKEHSTSRLKFYNIERFDVEDRFLIEDQPYKETLFD